MDVRAGGYAPGRSGGVGLRVMTREDFTRAADGRDKKSRDASQPRRQAGGLTLRQRDGEHALVNLGVHRRVVESVPQPEPEQVVALRPFQVPKSAMFAKAIAAISCNTRSCVISSFR